MKSANTGGAYIGPFLGRTKIIVAIGGVLVVFAAASGCSSGHAHEKPATAAAQKLSAPSAKPPTLRHELAAAGQPPYLIQGNRQVTVGVKADQPQTSVMALASSMGGASFSGFDIDLATYVVGQATSEQPVFSPVVTADRDQYLHDRHLDMVIATYSDTPQREKLVEMAGPYMRTDEGILVLRSTHDIRQLPDLRHKAVCTTTGSTTAGPGSPLTIPGAVGSLVKVSDISDCVKLLRERAVQAVASDLLILYGYQETSDDLIVAPAIDIAEPNEWMVGLQPGDTADCAKVLTALRSFLQKRWASEFQEWFGAVVQADPTWATDYRPDLQQEPLRCT